MSRLLQAYRAAHEQTFVPIFVDDGFDSHLLIDACLDAGMKCLEYTLRRHDAREMIPWIRKHLPEVYLLVGSTVDNEAIVRRQRRRFPQLMTIAEIEQHEPDGYVSMLGWSEQSIRQYAPRRVIMPTASTVSEAFFQIGAGAHFAKLSGADLSLVKRCRGDAAFGYCPIVVTGGQTADRIPQSIEAGAAMVASGFDLTLKGEDRNVSRKRASEVMKAYMTAAREARRQAWPELAEAEEQDMSAWLDALPHYHPF